MHCLKYEVSYRKTLLQGKAKELGMDTAFRPDELPKTLEELDLYKKTGKDPVATLFYLAEQVYQGPKGREALRRYSSGASAWLQLAWLLSSA
jgi:hypothetical protein